MLKAELHFLLFMATTLDSYSLKKLFFYYYFHYYDLIVDTYHVVTIAVSPQAENKHSSSCWHLL